MVSAIGHDGDRPVCDDVADLRCGTPSIAAQSVIPDLAVLRASLDRALHDAARMVDRRVTSAASVIDNVRWDTSLERRVASSNARLLGIGWQHALDFRIRREHDQLASIAWARVVPDRCAAAAREIAAIVPHAPLQRRCDGAANQLDLLRAQMEALSPARVLERGYAVVRTANGTVLRSTNETTSGDSLEITLAAGQLHVEVRHVST